jgi:anti-anti-sigma regulatory factor
MAGRLDTTTATNLDEVVGGLLADGTREIELCTDGLRVVDASAVGTLADIERRVRLAGGTLVRVAPANGPFRRSRLGSGAPPVPG